MTDALFLVEDLPVGESFVLDGDEGRHVATVKRVRVGEQLLVGDGRGTILTCVATELRRDAVALDRDIGAFVLTHPQLLQYVRLTSAPTSLRLDRIEHLAAAMEAVGFTTADD